MILTKESTLSHRRIAKERPSAGELSRKHALLHQDRQDGLLRGMEEAKRMWRRVGERADHLSPLRSINIYIYSKKNRESYIG